MIRFLLGICILWPLSRSAYAGEWDTVGGACVVNPLVGYAKLESGPTASFLSGTGGGHIVLYCPITNPNEISPSNLYMLYVASAATATDNITVTLFRMSKSDGTTSQVTQVQNTYLGCGATNGVNPKSCQVYFTTSWNPSLYIYYVQVDLVRVSGAIELFYGATLW